MFYKCFHCIILCCCVYHKTDLIKSEYKKKKKIPNITLQIDINIINSYTVGFFFLYILLIYVIQNNNNTLSKILLYCVIIISFIFQQNFVWVYWKMPTRFIQIKKNLFCLQIFVCMFLYIYMLNLLCQWQFLDIPIDYVYVVHKQH